MHDTYYVLYEHTVGAAVGIIAVITVVPIIMIIAIIMIMILVCWLRKRTQRHAENVTARYVCIMISSYVARCDSSIG